MHQSLGYSHVSKKPSNGQVQEKLGEAPGFNFDPNLENGGGFKEDENSFDGYGNDANRGFGGPFGDSHGRNGEGKRHRHGEDGGFNENGDGFDHNRGNNDGFNDGKNGFDYNHGNDGRLNGGNDGFGHDERRDQDFDDHGNGRHGGREGNGGFGGRHQHGGPFDDGNERSGSNGGYEFGGRW
ncbi:unnamed protein product [Bursaphelenchus xylophilus]|uniref:(pine wood nematode) hypothetical protein n=1 Tax=Bursaphelenchus xylophilus TaxID=6326 RepID=A0A1I7SRD8_BURXY|nr:unnamed protein product [Bursaphelenchus xylophilus]CAG9102561.1 unnamed protein product [Bursaphelenchus xylophilus]